MKSIAIQGTKRDDTGKKATKAVRRAGNIPCVIYGGKENIHFSTTKMSVRDLVYAADFKTVDVDVNGKTVKCVLKQTDFHPVTDEILHMDFIELVDTQPIKVELPIRFKGVAPGVKVGGKIIQKLRRAKVKTTPEHLVDELFVDISEMELGESVRVSQLEIGDGIEIMNAPGIPIASVEIPRALKSADAEAGEEGAEGEGAEGEGEGEKEAAAE